MSLCMNLIYQWLPFVLDWIGAQRYKNARAAGTSQWVGTGENQDGKFCNWPNVRAGRIVAGKGRACNWPKTHPGPDELSERYENTLLTRQVQGSFSFLGFLCFPVNTVNQRYSISFANACLQILIALYLWDDQWAPKCHHWNAVPEYLTWSC